MIITAPLCFLEPLGARLSRKNSFVTLEHDRLMYGGCMEAVWIDGRTGFLVLTCKCIETLAFHLQLCPRDGFSWDNVKNQ